MSRRLEDLTPAARAAALRALARLKADGIQVVVSYTLRTALEQYALWCQGRKTLAETNAARAAATAAGAEMPPIREYMGRDKKTHSDNDYTVTNCDGRRVSEGGTGRSPHQTGRALDVVPDLDPGEAQLPGWPPESDPRWAVIAAAFKAEGFEWGGDWEDFPDYPHYQLA